MATRPVGSQVFICAVRDDDQALDAGAICIFDPNTGEQLQKLTVANGEKFDLARHPEKAKATHNKMQAKDRPLENDFVTDEAFDALLDAWLGDIARVPNPGDSFYIWGGYCHPPHRVGPRWFMGGPVACDALDLVEHIVDHRVRRVRLAVLGLATDGLGGVPAIAWKSSRVALQSMCWSISLAMMIALVSLWRIPASLSTPSMVVCLMSMRRVPMERPDRTRLR